ncbi:hypothetical protein [Halobacillus litoralis]|uniref:hypothetical protein n=1 Tax=Halobacillus litoralis TaxID=45668 RepID=UPI001CFDE683|nr:hypothetical protein [Halobacillus litoralis]
MKNEASKKGLKRIYTVSLASILFLTIFTYVDEDQYNDYIGAWLLLIFWVVKILFDFISNRREGNKKLAVFDLLLMTAGIGILAWQCLVFSR